MEVSEFQAIIRATYCAKDSRRGIDGTFRWLVEETGELARAIRRGEPGNLREEFADVFAWLASLATLAGVDLEEASAKYARGCPKCGAVPCACPEPPSPAARVN